MKAICSVLFLAPVLLARDISTLDGRTFADCAISKVYPDSICVLFPGGGARIYFTNLTEVVRSEFLYDPARADEFEKSEAAREQRERAVIEAQRAQLAAQRLAWQTNAARVSNARTNRAPYAAVGGGYSGGGLGGAYNANFGGQSGNRVTGAEYVGVRM